jgi:hypothetical protein
VRKERNKRGKKRRASRHSSGNLEVAEHATMMLPVIGLSMTNDKQGFKGNRIGGFAIWVPIPAFILVLSVDVTNFYLFSFYK